MCRLTAQTGEGLTSVILATFDRKSFSTFSGDDDFFIARVAKDVVDEGPRAEDSGVPIQSDIVLL